MKLALILVLLLVLSVWNAESDEADDDTELRRKFTELQTWLSQLEEEITEQRTTCEHQRQSSLKETDSWLNKLHQFEKEKEKWKTRYRLYREHKQATGQCLQDLHATDTSLERVKEEYKASVGQAFRQWIDQ